MTLSEDRDKFLATVRQALGRSGDSIPKPPGATALSSSRNDLQLRVQEIRKRCAEKSPELVAQLEEVALKAKWIVTKVASDEEACQCVKELAREKEAKLIMSSTHPVLDRIRLNDCLAGIGVTVKKMALGEGLRRPQREAKGLFMRSDVIKAQIGITGADYAIAETGTCVLISRKGVSRLVSLTPPVHVAIVEPQQILETPDDLFTLRRWEFLEQGDIGSYMTFITGPSRTADIEQTITFGVHGPKEAHMVILTSVKS